MTLAPIEGFTTPGVMRIAADLLDESAETLKECHTLNGQWDDGDDAFVAYKREKTIARTLRERSEHVDRLRAELEAVTRERDDYKSLWDGVPDGELQKLGSVLADYLSDDAWNNVEPYLRSAEKERNTLRTQIEEMQRDDRKRSSEYTEGIMGDAAVILRNGEKITIGEVLQTLNNPAPSLPKGWIATPEEPDDKMLDAGVVFVLQTSVHGTGGWPNYVRALWHRMMKFAPEPKEGE